MMATLFLLPLIFTLSNGRSFEYFPTINCSHYISDSRTDEFQAQAIAMDVCRTYATSGNTEYRMYRCNGSAYFDELYTTQDCTGTPSSIEILENNDYGEECILDTTNTCQYIMMKTPCDNETDYQILPVLANVCIYDDRGDEHGFFSYQWQCDDIKKTGYDLNGENIATCDQELYAQFKSTDLTIGQCLLAFDGSTRLLEGLTDTGVGLPWEPITDCIDIIYGPTQDPTMEPTLDPTTDPTPIPTSPTMEPTLEPTEYTEAPTSQAPATPSPVDGIEPERASFINIITNYIFVLFLTSFIYFV